MNLTSPFSPSGSLPADPTGPLADDTAALPGLPAVPAQPALPEDDGFSELSFAGAWPPLPAWWMLGADGD